MSEDREAKRNSLIEFLGSEDGLDKLKKCGIIINDDFEKLLPIDNILKNIAYDTIEYSKVVEYFGQEWAEENWSLFMEVLYSKITPDCLIFTLADVDGNKIMSAYINAFQLFGTFETKAGIAGTICDSLFRTLIGIPTHRELIKSLEEDKPETIEFIKDQFDRFKNDTRTDTILNLVEKNSPRLRKLLKDKTGH